MDTAIEKPFADGVYRFWLPLLQITEIERTRGQRDRDDVLIPKSIFIIYDELSSGLAFDGEKPIYIGGGRAIVKDAQAVIRGALLGGNQGLVNGEQIEVGSQRANELIEVYTYPNRPLIESVVLAWEILHAAITGISVKKKDAPASEEASLSAKEQS